MALTEEQVNADLVMRGWYSVKEVVGIHKQLDCGQEVCGAKTCILCMGLSMTAGTGNRLW